VDPVRNVSAGGVGAFVVAVVAADVAAAVADA
jgi:hypothetical protein